MAAFTSTFKQPDTSSVLTKLVDLFKQTPVDGLSTKKAIYQNLQHAHSQCLAMLSSCEAEASVCFPKTSDMPISSNNAVPKERKIKMLNNQLASLESDLDDMLQKKKSYPSEIERLDAEIKRQQRNGSKNSKIRGKGRNKITHLEELRRELQHIEKGLPEIENKRKQLIKQIDDIKDNIDSITLREIIQSGTPLEDVVIKDVNLVDMYDQLCQNLLNTQSIINKLVFFTRVSLTTKQKTKWTKLYSGITELPSKFDEICVRIFGLEFRNTIPMENPEFTCKLSEFSDVIQSTTGQTVEQPPGVLALLPEDSISFSNNSLWLLYYVDPETSEYQPIPSVHLGESKGSEDNKIIDRLKSGEIEIVSGWELCDLPISSSRVEAIISMNPKFK